jgi:hypothetical protein
MFATITAAVLGGLGALAGIWAPVNLFIAKNNPMMSGFPGTPGAGGMPKEMAEFQEKVMAASLPEVTAGVGVLNLITGVFALWAALYLLNLKPGARARFKQAMLALGIYEIIAIVTGIVIQLRVMSVMDELMGKLMRSGGGSPPPPGFEQTMGAAMQVGVVIGIVTAVVWGGAKIFFAFWARSFADKPEVVAYAGE